jgi:hypothetical protein
MGLHDRAPRYVGLRTHGADETHCVRANSAVPELAAAEARWDAFEKWVTGVKGIMEEERGVIPWLRRALENQLWLPELGAGWVFLNHEWRFLDDAGAAKKTDVLAVHLPTGRLGIVELKADSGKLHQAGIQVDAYQRYWERDAKALAPLFTDVLRAQAIAYENDAAAVAQVKPMTADLFVGVATRGGVKVSRR